jgi:drug/metabolite transporter (DMT)-like permease
MSSRTIPWSRFGLLLVALGAATWGTDTALRAGLLGGTNAPFTPVPLVLAEHAILAIYAIPMLIRNWREIRGLDFRHWLALIFVAWGGSAIATVIFSQGLADSFALPFSQAVQAFNTVFLLQQTQPLFAIVTAAIILRERLTVWYIPIFIVAAAGAFLVAPFLLLPGMSVTTPFGQVTQAPVEFMLAGLGAAALWGGATAFGRYLSDKLAFGTLTAARFGVALPLLLVWAIVVTPNLLGVFQRGLGSPHTVVYLILLSLIPGLLGLLLYYRGLGYTRASYATLAELAFPATGAVLNAVVLHKPPTGLQIAGVALIALAVFAAQWVRSGVRVAGAVPAMAE